MDITHQETGYYTPDTSTTRQAREKTKRGFKQKITYIRIRVSKHLSREILVHAQGLENIKKHKDKRLHTVLN